MRLTAYDAAGAPGFCSPCCEGDHAGCGGDGCYLPDDPYTPHRCECPCRTKEVGRRD